MRLEWFILLIAVPFGSVVAGWLLLWWQAWACHRRRAADIGTAIGIVGWFLLLGGTVVLSVGLTGVFAPVLIVTMLVVVLSAFARSRKAENRALAWTLAAAAERGIPLESAARAFAAERQGWVSERAYRLAEYLDAAVPLSLALQRSGLGVSPDVLLAADVGEVTGTLGPSLRRTVEQTDAVESHLWPAYEKVFYIAVLAFVGIGITTFLMIKIVPTFAMMFEEFALSLPAMTVLLIDVSRFCVNYWYLFMPLMMVVGLAALVSVLSYLGVPFHGVPIIGRFSTLIGTAAALQVLSVSVSRGRPMLESLELLSRYNPRPHLQYRLAKAAQIVRQGIHWSDALCQAGLVRRSISDVFQSAERAGNLEWALREMADSVLRRSARCARSVVNVVFPVLVMSFGGFVLFLATAILLPLFSLIAALA